MALCFPRVRSRKVFGGIGQFCVQPKLGYSDLPHEETKNDSKCDADYNTEHSPKDIMQHVTDAFVAPAFASPRAIFR